MTGRELRMLRLRRRDGLLVVPLDHGVSAGPIRPAGTLDDLVAELVANGADAIVLHKGATRQVRPERFRDAALIVHLSAGTGRGPDPDDKRIVTGVAESLRLGADAVSVHLNVGSRHESRQLADLGAVAGACDRWGVPLLAMVYPRGPGVTDPQDPERIAQAVTIAAELGADLVKTVFPRTPADLARIARACPIPLLVAGGPAGGDLIARVREAMRAGAAGAAIGRAIFQAADPGAMTRKVSDAIHNPSPPVDHELGVMIAPRS